MKAPTVTDVVCVSHQCGVTVRAFLLSTLCGGPSLHRRCVGLPCCRGNSVRPGAVGSSLERMKAGYSGEMLRKRRWLVQSLTVQYRRPQSSDSPHPSLAVCICSCWSRAS
ncbi:ribonuclease HI [Trypanosoma cruzi]|nr:ribonuclease HI [Trypanosoma cruzi]